MVNNNLFSNIIKGIYQRFSRPLLKNHYKKIGFSLLKVKLIKNLPAKKLQSVNLFNKKISFFSREEFSSNLEEIFLHEIYKAQLPKDAFIIDCGANIGLSTLYFKRQSPAATIIAFEPDDLNFKLLKNNVEAFGLNNVELRKEAVWIEDTQLTFLNTGTLSSKIVEDKDLPGKVTAIRLKDRMKITIDLLKIDIEGAEYKVLIDIQEKLPLVKNIFLEYHGTFKQNSELNEILHILTKYGFQYYIKEATNKHPTPFIRKLSPDYDVQLNIFGFRD